MANPAELNERLDNLHDRITKIRDSL